ncbi:MAG: 50S ribosomal protein L23 [Spirochaetia bacterium]
MRADQVIIEPVVTEKTNEMKETNKYVFKVDARASKTQVTDAIQKLFSVTPVNCNVMNVKRKPKRQRYQIGYTATWKKAVVTLAPGDTIDIFEGA